VQHNQVDQVIEDFLTPKY